MGVILTLLCGVFSEELISCVIDSEIWYAARPDVAAVGTSDGYPVYLYQHLAGDRGGSGTTCSRHSFPPSGCLAVLAD